MLLGSCLCGGIQFEINEKLYEPLNCHCSMCRKAKVLPFEVGQESDLEIFVGLPANVC